MVEFLLYSMEEMPMSFRKVVLAVCVLGLCAFASANAYTLTATVTTRRAACDPPTLNQCVGKTVAASSRISHRQTSPSSGSTTWPVLSNPHRVSTFMDASPSSRV